MGQPIRILFVCHGNICRSPMAEYVFCDLARQRGIADRFQVASAATSTEEIGNDVYPRVQDVLRSHDIACPHRAARQIRRSDADAYDYFIGMDDKNVRNIRRMLGVSAEGSVYKLMEFAGSHGDVVDPWYSRDFEACYEDVVAGCKGLLSHLGF